MRSFWLSLVLIFTLITESISQNTGINNYWLTGYQSFGGGNFGNCRINFFSGNINMSNDSLEMGFWETSTTMSDTNGNILFYTNGFDIDDSSDNVMLNGDTISPSGYRGTMLPGTGLDIVQAVLTIPMPGSTNLFYLFHSTKDNAPFYDRTLYLYYSIIDMNGNGGKGEVISKNNILINDTLNFGKIIACKHGNGRDWWITCLRENSNLIYKFLITPYGISGPYSQNIGIIKGIGFGQCKFSQDGTKFACFNADYFALSNLELFDFDRCSGIFSNSKLIIVSGKQAYGGGVEFSPNSNLLYVSNIDSVYQYDLTSANISQSQTLIAVWDSFYSPYPPFATLFFNCQLAPDGKIYLGTGNSTKHFHVINYPDSVGLACNFVQHAIPLQYFQGNSLPNHPNYFLGPGPGNPCNNLGFNSPQNSTGIIHALPNPSTGQFTVWFSVNKDVGWLEIYNTNGELIRKEPVAQWSQYKQVDLTKQSNGIYFCKMTWKDGEGSVKVIKE